MKTLRPLLRKPQPRLVNGGATSRSLRSPVTKKAEVVTTVTLLRGRVYFFYNIPFEVGQETAIDEALVKKYNVPISPEELVEEIGDLYENVVDSDKEEFSKPTFEVRHNRPRPLTPEEQQRADRPRRVRQFIEVPDHREDTQPARAAAPGRPRSVGLMRR